MADFNTDIENCLKVLQEGGIILYPTDTIWGIGCDATNAVAVKKVYALKKREESKSMIVLLAEVKDLIKYVANPDVEVFNYLESVKKPTTVIYEGALGVAANVMNKDGSLAIRIVKDEFCKQLIKRFRKPIISTSANISGQPTAHTFAEISDGIKNGVDYLVSHRQGDKQSAGPSALVKWINDNVIVIRP